MNFIQRIKRAHKFAKMDAENKRYKLRLARAQALLVEIEKAQAKLPANFHVAVQSELPELKEMLNQMLAVLRHRENEVALELKKG